ncbi:anti-sigma regulatory factor [Pseudonocardia sp. EC080619-01]|uniref:ATP-binding protein n=1 Tax=Pseudonocardia sp. EC080619-01 TaxID=1096856 RepID=UPI000A54FE5E|nr:ATP-binding protein [Pseudonocardia sp. EC080619-01]
MTDLDFTAESLCLGRCDQTALRRLRHWLRQRVRNPDLAIDAALVVTELVTNAIEHAGGVRAVRMSVAPTSRVRVEVDDWAPGTAPTIDRSRFSGSHGYGMVVVDHVASWGVRYSDLSSVTGPASAIRQVCDLR